MTLAERNALRKIAKILNRITAKNCSDFPTVNLLLEAEATIQCAVNRDTIKKAA